MRPMFVVRIPPYYLDDLSKEEKRMVVKVVRGWLKKMVMFIDTKRCSASDELIVCPRCDVATLQHNDTGGWRCLNRHCDFRFPVDFNPPSPDRLKEIIERLREEKMLRRIFQETAVKFPV